MVSDRNEVMSAPQPLVVKVRMETDFDEFVKHDGVRSALVEFAAALGIAVKDIALLDIRKGCVIIVLSLPEEAGQRLLNIHDLSSNDDSLRALATTLNISKVIEGDVIENTELLRANRLDFNTDVCWLHLSDLHVTSDYEDQVSDTFADLNRFLEDLPKCLENVGLIPDATFFTGDIAQSGSEDDYEAAHLFFANLQEVLPPSSRLAPMYIVPGNHDVTWSAIEINRELELRSQLKSSSDPTSILEEYAEHINSRQRNFRYFIERLQDKLAMPPLDGFSFAHSFAGSSRDVRVSVAGFNSSWLSTRKDLYKATGAPHSEDLADLDLQHLWLGAKQLRSLALSPHFKNSNIHIALMHHEPLSEWYAEADRAVQRQELSRYDFVLRGHQHETRARVGAKIAGRDDFVELAPGALRTKPHWYQGFMTTELDLRAGWMRLRTWSVSGLARRWVPDPEFGNGGVERRPLPDHMRLFR